MSSVQETLKNFAAYNNKPPETQNLKKIQKHKKKITLIVRKIAHNFNFSSTLSFGDRRGSSVGKVLCQSWVLLFKKSFQLKFASRKKN